VPTKRDNFVTYPIIQQIAGSIAIVDVLRQLDEGIELPFVNSDKMESKLWTHPGIFEYFKNGVC
jgi:hypothetical protein